MDHIMKWPVFLLAGSPNGSRSRHFEVPANTYLLVPLLVSEWSQLELGFNQTAAQIRLAAQQQANQINSLHATLDGTVISQATLFTHLEVSPDFNFVAVANNQVGINAVGPSGIAVADGYFLMIDPLTPGTHVLNYGGGASAIGVSIDETDTITVLGTDLRITQQPLASCMGSNRIYQEPRDNFGINSRAVIGDPDLWITVDQNCYANRRFRMILKRAQCITKYGRQNQRYNIWQSFYPKIFRHFDANQRALCWC